MPQPRLTRLIAVFPQLSTNDEVPCPVRAWTLLLGPTDIALVAGHSPAVHRREWRP
jgi:hypothetical protein